MLTHIGVITCNMEGIKHATTPPSTPLFSILNVKLEVKGA